MSLARALELPEGWTISPRLMPCWRIDSDHRLEIAADDRTDDDRIRWAYRLSHRNRTIFTGNDFRSGAGAEYTTDELARTAAGLLGFLTLRPGDTDANYFRSYTKAQICWRDEHAEELSLYAIDRDCGYCGGEHDSPACPAPRDDWRER